MKTDSKNCPNEFNYIDDSKDIQILSISYDSSDESEKENEKEGETSDDVPLSVTLVFVFFYIFGGAYVFMKFENWSLVQSIYFVYVTLTTIGI